MSAHDAAPGAAPGEPTEEELRAAYEAELSRLTTTDLIAQAVVSLLNLGARRMAPAPGDAAGSAGAAGSGDAAGSAGAGRRDRDPAHPQRDLAQARDAIDAVRALLEILERSVPQEVKPLRDALSQLQMAYAREVAPGARAAAAAQGGGPGGPAGGPGGPAEPAGGEQQPQAQEGPRGPGPAESSGRLWVPGR